MKVRLIAALLALFWAGCTDDTGATKRAAQADVFPRTVASEEKVMELMNFHLGGHIEKVQVGATDYLVAFQHGSGFPVIRIAVYRHSTGRWQLVARPAVDRGEFLQVEVSEGKILVRGQRSHKSRVIFNAN